MKNTKENKQAATFAVSGEVTELYSGAKNDYLSIKTERGQYYDIFRVAAPKDSGAEVGDKLTISGRMETFWNKEKKVSVVNLYADTIKEA